MSAYPDPAAMEEVSLLEVVDTALEKGVVIHGDATISVADVDLVYLGLRLVLASVDTLDMGGKGNAGRGRRGSESGHIGRARAGGRSDSSAFGAAAAQPPPRPIPTSSTSASAESRGPWADSEKVEQGLAKLVLTVVDLLRQVLERQAVRRMERGSLSDEEVERMGTTFQRLEAKMGELKRVFGLEGEELNLNLGPLGNLM